MSTELGAYPEYQDSGLLTPTVVPAHWKIRRLKETITSCRNGVWGEDPDGVNDIACVRVADFDRVSLRVRMKNPTIRAVPNEQRRGRIVRHGDLLLEKSGGGELQPVGAVVIYDHQQPAVCSNFVARMSVARGHEPRFLVFLHSYLYSIRLNTRSIKQTIGIQNLDSDQYLDEGVALPPFEEQTAIAEFLDRQDHNIQRFIRAKRRMIELLNEQKQAIIQRAVTRGLDPDVRLKPSGVEWLGDVPEHWDVLRLRNVARLNPSKSEIPRNAEHDEVVFLPMERVGEDGSVDCHVRRQASDVSAGFTYFAKSDVIVAKITPCFENGKGACLEGLETEFGFGSTEFIVIRPGSRIDSRFLYLITASPAFRRLGKEAMVGAAGQQRIPTDYVKDYLVALPPREEQVAILMYVDNELAQIDRIVSRARIEISLIREYRTRLVADVVTGKLDVRGAKLPSLDMLDVTEEWEDGEADELEEFDADAEAADADA